MTVLKSMLNKSKKSPKTTSRKQTTQVPDLTQNLISQDLVQKNMEVEKLKKKNRELELAQQALISKQQQEIVGNEVRKSAAKHRVIDDAMDDVLSIMKDKFHLKDNRITAKDKDADVDTVMAEFLETRQHYIAPQPAQSTFATVPQANRPAPVLQHEIPDPRTREGSDAIMSIILDQMPGRVNGKYKSNR